MKEKLLLQFIIHDERTSLNGKKVSILGKNFQMSPNQIFDKYGDIKEAYQCDTYKITVDEENFVPKTITFTGRRLDCEDVFEQSLNSFFSDETTYEFLYVDVAFESLKNRQEKLQEKVYKTLICAYRGDFRKYSLDYATNEYRYYSYNDEFLMMDDAGKPVSTVDSFVYCGLVDSIEAVDSGDETLLFCGFKKEELNLLLGE